MYIGLHVKYLLFLSEFFRKDFRKILISVIEITPLGWPSCSVRAEGRTDRHEEANSRFSHFCEDA